MLFNSVFLGDVGSLVCCCCCPLCSPVPGRQASVIFADFLSILRTPHSLGFLMDLELNYRG